MNFKPLALACAAVAAAPAHAAFTGAYDPSNWTTTSTNGGNGTASVSSDNETLTLTSADFDVPVYATTLDYAIKAATATTITFSWSYGSDDISSSNDPFGYAVNGVSTQLSKDKTAGFIEQDGMVTLSLNKGDTFSFEASSIDGVGGASTTTITGFNAVSAVPEPASVALMLAGVGLLAGAARRRRQG